MAAGFDWFWLMDTQGGASLAPQDCLPKNSRFFTLCACISFGNTVDYLGVRPKSTRMPLTNMKTTFLTALFAAAAIVGSQASAYDHVYTLSLMNDNDYINADGEVLVNINAQRTLYQVATFAANILTLDFQGSYILKASDAIDTPDYGILNITSTVDAVKTKWEETFSVEGGGSITLCSAGGMGLADDYDRFQFFGTAEQGTVKLGNTDVKFMGEVKNGLSDLAMNQVGVVWGAKEITLVGKVEKSVPEPATGSLSLLALAGLCARRRRK